MPQAEKDLEVFEKKNFSAANSKKQSEGQFIKEAVDKEDIAAVVSVWTGISLTRVLEGESEKLEKKLPKLTSFILPQGGEIAVLFHIARTVCRRAERSVMRYFHEKLQVTSPPAGRAGHKSQVISYLNRLSDLLFMMARKYSQKEERININKS